MLELTDVQAGYGRVQVLRGISFSAKAGEILCLLGRNGAGKTTTLKTIMRLLPLQGGSITFDGDDIGTLRAHEIAGRRIGYIPQGRRLFAELTVSENIDVGLLDSRGDARTRDWVLDMFPRLRERLKQQAGTLSGGEQQMLATARALCLRPRALLLDEPTEGLQPSMIDLIRDVVLKMKADGIAVILVEQRVDAVLAIADHVVFIENGATAETLNAADLQKDPAKLTRYLGVV